MPHRDGSRIGLETTLCELTFVTNSLPKLFSAPAPPQLEFKHAADEDSRLSTCELPMRYTLLYP